MVPITTSTETTRLISDGEEGEGGMEVGEREIIYLSLHCHHQNDFCTDTFVILRYLYVTFERTQFSL